MPSQWTTALVEQPVTKTQAVVVVVVVVVWAVSWVHHEYCNSLVVSSEVEAQNRYFYIDR